MTIQRTDQLGKVFAFKDTGSVYTDYTTEANSQTTPGDDFTPWATPEAGDMLYFGHASVMWNQLGLWLTTLGAGITGVWEYYDGEWSKDNPTEVVLSGSQLNVNLNSYLGASDRSGATVRVQYNETGAYEDLVSLWDGSKNYVLTSGYLGQTTPKYNSGGGSPTTNAQQYYSVGAQWEELESPTDGTSGLTSAGNLEFTLPQDLTKNWTSVSVNSSTQYWLRFRIISVSTPTAPVLQYARIDQGDQFVKASVTQGRSYEEAPIGSSDGTANQEFETIQENFVWGSETVTVEGEEWTRVENFISSLATDKHYSVKLGENDKATIVFGDGTTGQIPPSGIGNISCSYRYTGTENGNVGADTIISDKTGMTYVSSLFNPRQATGWEEAEGATESSLELAKIAGPASLRVINVALGPNDVELLTKEYINSGGTKLFSRSKAIEEGFGPKTIENVVVSKGGGQVSSEQLTELDEYFNGDQYSYPVKEKKLVSNQELTSVNYTQKVIDVTATVYGSVDTETIENALQAVLQPEALRDDGATWEWNFGEEVPVSRISHEIFSSSDDITRVDLTEPASNVSLGSRELPVLGTVTLTIVDS